MSHEPLDEFDRIMTGVPMVSAFQAVWNEAEEMLREACPQGFTPEDIGHVAFDMLPEAETDAARDELFYTYWAATMADRELHAARDGAA